MIIKFYNRITFLKRVEEKSGYNIPYNTLTTWERNNKFAASGMMDDGKREIPVYTEDDVDRMVEIIRLLQNTMPVRIRLTSAL